MNKRLPAFYMSDMNSVSDKTRDKFIRLMAVGINKKEKNYE